MLRSVVLTCMVTLQPIAAVAGTLTTLANLPAHVDGADPAAALVQFNGAFYGTTSAGGAGQAGTIFQLDPTTGKETLLYSFVGNPVLASVSPLTAVAGKLYGTTATGGAADNGTVFNFDPATGAETLLYSFPDLGTQPTGALIELGGLLYGTAAGGGANDRGYIFTIDPATGAETTVYSFKDGNDGAFPQGGLVIDNGKLYGVTSSGGSMLYGTLFRLDPATNAVTTLHAFDADNSVSGYSPSGLTVLGDVLYGTAEFGSPTSEGTVYSFDLSSNQFSVVYAFSPNGTNDGFDPASGLIVYNGLLYGTTFDGGSFNGGTVFSVDPATGRETVLYSFNGQDGYEPQAALIEANGLLLGTTSYAGVEGNGNVFSLDPSSGTEQNLYSFLGNPRSENSALISFRGNLYGPSTRAGTSTTGSILKVDAHTGAATTLYSFSGPDGVEPSTALVNIGGVLYGGTSRGGSHNAGTLFSFDPTTNKQTTIFNFDGVTSAKWPNGLASVSGMLFGSTLFGNSGSNDGVLFSFAPASRTLTTLHVFSQTEGSYALPGLVAVNGTLFGATSGGGSNNGGTVFSYVLSSGTFSTVHDFSSDASEYPTAGLVYANGVLIGSTMGHKKNPATIFQVDPATGAESVLQTLSKPEALSTMVAAGNALYGVITYLPYPYGSIFRFSPATKRFNTVYDFTGGADGGNPDSALLAINNHLYGTTQSSAVGSAGTVFRFDP